MFMVGIIWSEIVNLIFINKWIFVGEDGFVEKQKTLDVRIRYSLCRKSWDVACWCKTPRFDHLTMFIIPMLYNNDFGICSQMYQISTKGSHIIHKINVYLLKLRLVAEMVKQTLPLVQNEELVTTWLKNIVTTIFSSDLLPNMSNFEWPNYKQINLVMG